MDRLIGSGTNHERLADGFAGVLRAFAGSISQLLERNDLDVSSVKDVVAGLSGADNEAQVETLADLLRQVGLVRVLVCNDGYLPLKAECEAGIAYNCGTGVCCAVIDSRGTMRKIGGLDEWSDDAGGGAWLLTQIFKSVYDDVVLSLDETELTARYASVLGVLHTELVGQIDESLARVKAESELQKVLIAEFFEAYLNGDAAAVRVCTRMIRRAADYISAAYRNCEFDEKPVPIVLAGSILLKAAPHKYLQELKAVVEQRMGAKARWIDLEHTAVYGAAQWLRQRNA